MIPKTIHYCWFGRGQMPQMVKDCIASWRAVMPEWEIRQWDEDSFDVNAMPYTREAYQARKFAFVSDVCRLKALIEEGGVYLDTDVVAFRPFDDLLDLDGFGGFEGSKSRPVGTCVLGARKGSEWASQMLSSYEGRHFLMQDGSLDMTANTAFLTDLMCRNGFVCNGKKQQYLDFTVFPVDYFSPRHTTGEYIKTENTYTDHLGAASWTSGNAKYARLRKVIGQKNMTRLIKLKRLILG